MSVIVRRIVVAVTLLLFASPALAQSPPISGLEGFGIVLVLGDVQDGGAGDNIPASARAALYDLKDFLPYRSYRVLDTAWLLASSTTRQAVSSRLQGPDEQVYEVMLDRMPVGPSSLQVHFMMREPDTARQAEAVSRHDDRLAMLRRQMMDNREQLKRAESRLNPSHPDVAMLRRRMVELEAELERLNSQGPRYASGEATLIDTSFNMALDETVVVGTSRMRGGNKALIVLLTAATRGTKPRE